MGSAPELEAREEFLLTAEHTRDHDRAPSSHALLEAGSIYTESDPKLCILSAGVAPLNFKMLPAATLNPKPSTLNA